MSEGITKEIRRDWTLRILNYPLLLGLWAIRLRVFNPPAVPHPLPGPAVAATKRTPVVGQ